MTARLYGGEEGWTLYPTYCRSNTHRPAKPAVDIWEIVQGATLLFILGVIVVMVMGGF